MEFQQHGERSWSRCGIPTSWRKEMEYVWNSNIMEKGGDGDGVDSGEEEEIISIIILFT